MLFPRCSPLPALPPSSLDSSLTAIDDAARVMRARVPSCSPLAPSHLPPPTSPSDSRRFNLSVAAVALQRRASATTCVRSATYRGGSPSRPALTVSPYGVYIDAINSDEARLILAALQPAVYFSGASLVYFMHIYIFARTRASRPAKWLSPCHCRAVARRLRGCCLENCTLCRELVRKFYHLPIFSAKCVHFKPDGSSVFLATTIAAGERTAI